MLAEILFAAAALTAIYILVLYPVLLATLPLRGRPAVQKDLKFQTSISVILAVYNGGKLLRAKLESIRMLNYPAEKLEILVVSDGSTDETDAIAAEYAQQGVKLIRRPHEGKAAAVNEAVKQATGEILFFTDVRQLLDPMAIAHLAANFADPTVGAVTGELHLTGAEGGEPADMGLYWRYEIWARSRHSYIDSLFNTTGCIYALRRDLFTSLPADTLSDDAALPLGAFFRGYRVIFDPQAVAFDYSEVAGGEFRRRWRNLAGLWQVHTRIPAIFSSSNRMRFYFLSHKFGRLILPWSLLATAAATVALPDSFFRPGALLAEGLVVALALVDRWVPAGWPGKRVSSLARTFLVMNAAALAAITVFWISPQSLWKPTQMSQHRSQ